MTNDLTEILDKILARGLLALRQQALMPILVTRDFEREAAEKGDVVNIPYSHAKVAQNVTPAPTFSSGQNTAFGNIQLPLDQWKHVDFYLNDKQRAEIDENAHFMPLTVAEAIKAIANVVDGHVHSKYPDVYGFVGAGGVVPFSTLNTVTDTRRTLNTQLAPMGPRYMLLDPDAEAQALLLDPLRDMDRTGIMKTPVDGELGRKMGFDWFMSQNVTSHTAGTLVTNGIVASTAAASASTMKVKSSAAAGTMLVGDVFTIAGQTQTYVVKANTGSITSAAAGVAVRFDPPLQAAASANRKITLKASHTVNLAFHPGAFALATRPLKSTPGLGSIIRSMTDPMTGISLRLELSRQYKQETFDIDILYGAICVRPELAVRIAG